MVLPVFNLNNFKDLLFIYFFQSQLIPWEPLELFSFGITSKNFNDADLHSHELDVVRCHIKDMLVSALDRCRSLQFLNLDLKNYPNAMHRRVLGSITKLKQLKFLHFADAVQEPSACF
ncbi:hypothetical protein WICPIJ_004815 [Wickerhamomyces pijperi]|uniref:Uncharacterized protein n=1 Tax=Wickerhamomyces pijperi TaxID=599730 RepID=A0A9P8Q765_WICPI|nr:hypothetical protein WICPIJ_004815 [Wickerhamomyces pijperi]